MRRASPAPRFRGPFRISLCAFLTLGVSTGLITGGWSLRAAAQDPGGIRFSFGVNQRFEADTNQRLQTESPGASYSSTTRFSFGLRSETRNQSLRLGADLPLRLFSIPGDSRRFATDTPDLNFTYNRVAAQSDLLITGSSRRDDLRFFRPIDAIVDILDPTDPADPLDPVDPLPDPDDPTLPDIDPVEPTDPLPPGLDELPDDEELDDVDLIDGRGTRQLIQLGSRLRVGLGGPVTTTFNLNLRELRYSGDANPALNDTRRLTFGTVTTLRLTPVTEGTVDLLAERFERDDPAEFRRDTRRIGFGIRHELTQTLTANARLGYSWIDIREFDTVRQRRGVDAGLGLDLELTRGSLSFDSRVLTTDEGRLTTASLTRSLPMPNGALSFSASARRNVDGTRTSFTVGRDMDLRRGPLSANVGLSRSPAGDWGTIGRVNYGETLPRGSWRVSLLQGFSIDEANEETRRTLATASFTHIINQSSRINLGAAYSATPDRDNARFTATYSRDVTRDWSMNLGYRYDNRSRDDGQADSHAVFLSIGRSFNTAF